MDPLRDELSASLGGAFTLLDEMTGGGMSRVYRARDERLGRDIVVKALRPDLAERLSVERFTREIRVAAALQEPHIVSVLDAGRTESGVPYYTMPFVRGESLRARLDRGGPLDPREGIAILRDVARALVYAHGRGVVHRDIKPENVLLAGATAVVTDFGIAKAVVASRESELRDSLTGPGMALGTPAYMAPEQAAGDPQVDHRADLYAWGVVAYEALAGQHPFGERATPRAMMVAHLTVRPSALDETRLGLPAPVAAIVMRCLEKDPADRPRDATELIDALEAASGWPAMQTRRRVADRVFRLTDDVCRRIDRTVLDPRIIGDSMQYLENDAPAGVLVVCIHGMGHDAAEFAPLLESTAHRALAVTLYGFEVNTNRARVPLDVAAHVALVRELVRDAIDRLAPTRVVLMGFSSGADVAIRMLVDPPADAPRVDACLALGPNLSIETCFVSRVFAHLQAGDAASSLPELRRIGEDAVNLDEWLNMMTYVLHALRKFRDDLAPLSRFAWGIQHPFAECDDTFASWFAKASQRVDVLRCVFEQSATCERLVHALRLRNLDDRMLGPAYDASSLVLEPTKAHLALMEPPRIAKHLDAVLGALGQ